jgi:hypothetical protein
VAAAVVVKCVVLGHLLALSTLRLLEAVLLVG